MKLPFLYSPPNGTPAAAAAASSTKFKLCDTLGNITTDAPEPDIESDPVTSALLVSFVVPKTDNVDAILVAGPMLTDAPVERSNIRNCCTG